MSALVEQLLQALAGGLFVGCVYRLMRVGLAFIFDFMMVGMHFAIFNVTSVISTAYLGLVAPFAAALATAPVMFAGGYCPHRFLVTQTVATRHSHEGGSR